MMVNSRVIVRSGNGALQGWGITVTVASKEVPGGTRNLWRLQLQDRARPYFFMKLSPMK